MFELDVAAPFITVVGDPKVMKTANLLRLLPAAGCIGDRSAIETTATGQLGLLPSGLSSDPERYFIFPKPVRRLEQIVPVVKIVYGKMVEAALKRGLSQEAAEQEAKRRGVIVDDVTQRASATLAALFAEADRLGEGQNWAYQKLKTVVAATFEGMKAMGIPIGISFHQSPPSFKDKNNLVLQSKGCLDCGSRGRAGAVGGHQDLIMFGYTDQNALEIWKTARVTGRAMPQDPLWETGDRFGSAFEGQPFNVREHINASPAMGGTKLPRLSGLEWQESVADTIAAELRATKRNGKLEIGPTVIAAVREAFAEHGSGAKVGQILSDRRDLLTRWAVQDGFARAQFQEAMERDIFSDFSAAGSGGAAPDEGDDL